MSGLERRRFLVNLLAAIPALRLSARGASLTSTEPGALQEPAGGILVASGEDRFHATRAIGVSSTTFKVSAGDTRHSLFAMEHHSTIHGGPPLHVHREADEFWYVLAGEYVIEVGGQQFQARGGDCVLGPRGVPHRWAFVGQSPGRLLITFTPAGRMEDFFGRPRTSNAYADDPALYQRFGMELLGPPLPVK